MKKLLTLIILLIIFSSLFFLIFHDRGNDYLKPYLSTYLEKEFDNNISVEIQHLKIDQEYLELKALINHNIILNAHGQVIPLEKRLNIDYELFGFEDNIDVNGTLKGHFNDMVIRGDGDAFKSNLHYTLNLKDDVLNNINIQIKQAEIAEILLLSAQPAYATGKLDIDINIPSLDENFTKGSTHILLHETLLNESLLNKTFKTNLPPKTILSGNIDGEVNREKVNFTGELKSSLAKLQLTNAKYDIKEEILASNYTLSIPKLAQLYSLTNQKLKGKLVVNGSLKLNKNDFSLKGESKSLGGKTYLNLKNNQLNAELKNIEITKLLHMLGERPLVKGQLLGQIKFKNLKTLNGTFNLKTVQAKTINHTFKKELNIDFGKAVAFQLHTQGQIAKKIAHIQTKLDSELFSFNSNDMQYHLDNATLFSSYLLNIPKLSKLNAVAGKKLQGSLDIAGKIQSDKTLLITGNSQNLGGDISFKLKNDQLNTLIKEVSVQKLMYLLNYPQIFKASIVGDFNYNLSTRKGLFNSKLHQAQLLPNNLTKLIKQIRGVDLTKERYNETTLVARLHKNNINFDFNAKSKKVTIAIPNGRINKAKNSIDANYKVNIEKKDIAGKIKGNISKPHITIDSSQFIKDNVINAIQEHIGGDKLKDLGIGEKEKDAIKNILGDLFK